MIIPEPENHKHEHALLGISKTEDTEVSFQPPLLPAAKGKGVDTVRRWSSAMIVRSRNQLVRMSFQMAAPN